MTLECLHTYPHKGLIMLRLSFSLALALIGLVSNVYAMPAFSRQMGISCNSCHSQNGYPALNAYGRDFKASGYTMLGKQKMIEDPEKRNFLSLPETLNASFVVKVRAKDGSDAPRTLEFPDEAALVVGGRVAEHVGAFVEIGYHDDGAGERFGLANFKLPITYKVEEHTFGVVPYRTEGFGPAASFEVLNTGAVRNARVLEERSVISSQQYIGTATEAEGLGLYLYNRLWNIVYSAWVPANGTVTDYTPAHYARAVLTPKVGEWDVGLGGQLWWGTAKRQDDNNITGPQLEDKTEAYALDFQAMGSISELPVSVFATYANAKNDPNSLYNTGTDDKSAATLLGEVALMPSELMLSAGYRIADNGQAVDSSDDAVILGVKYFFMENVEFQLDYSHHKDLASNKNQLLLMLYAVF